jgi:UMP-CMP kinase family protein
MDSNQKPKVLFVLGGPGSGKGTQCDNLVKTYKFQHLSAGDLLREEVKRGTPLSEEINGYISKGHMVPGETTVRLIRQAMNERGWNKHVFIIDGFPRTFNNLDAWNTIMKNDIDVIGVLFLHCSEEIMRTRIMKRGETSGRSDDNEEVFKTRIRVYIEETTPVVDHYRKQDKVFEVNAEGSVEEGFEEIRKIVEALKLNHIEELNEMRSYLHNNVDPYIRQLMSYLIKNRPPKVHGAIKHWIENEGEEIRKNVEKE